MSATSPRVDRWPPDAMRADQWSLHPPHRERHHQIEPGTVLISISFRTVWPSGVPLLDMPRSLVVDGHADASLRRAARGVCRAIEGGRRASRRPLLSRSLDVYRLRGRLSLFAAELFERAAALGCVLTYPGSGDDRLDWVLGEMRRDLRAGPLPSEQWSHCVRLSRSQLDRLCRRLLGPSWR